MATPLLVGKAALLVIDMQHDFVDPEAGCYAMGAEKIVEPIRALVSASRSSGIPVVYTQEAHRRNGCDTGREADAGSGWGYPGGGSTTSAVPPHCIEGTRGIEIVSELEPQEDDLRIVKRRYSCFLGTDLDLVLRQLGVETLLLTGVCSNVCVLWTVGDAFQRDYHVRVIEDCTAGSSSEEHEAALLIMRALVSAGRPCDSKTVLSALGTDRNVPELAYGGGR